MKNVRYYCLILLLVFIFLFNPTLVKGDIKNQFFTQNVNDFANNELSTGEKEIYDNFLEIEDVTDSEKAFISMLVYSSLKDIENYMVEVNAYAAEYLIPGTTSRIAYMYEANKTIAKKIYTQYKLLYNSVSPRSQAAAVNYRINTFVNLVKSGGEWDLKRELGTTKTYYLIGNLRSGEYIGNHHFGAMGRHVGFELNFLKAGAGFYQIVSDTSNWSFIKSFFDDPKDQEAINSGYYQYNHRFFSDKPIEIY